MYVKTVRQVVVGPHETLRFCACSGAGDGPPWSVLHGVTSQLHVLRLWNCIFIRMASQTLLTGVLISGFP